MAHKENILRFPSELFTYDDGTDINPRRWNKNDNPICVIPGCNETAHNKGRNHGGFMLQCKKHLNLVGKDSYKNYKYVVPYCENIDGRLGFTCTTTIEHSVMLGVDHIDENRSNDDPTNWQTLCACCDRVKTNLIGKKVKSGKLSVPDMLEYFEINKRIKKKIATMDDMMKRNEIDAIIGREPHDTGTFTKLIKGQA